MENDFITRYEHNEFCLRQDEENKRQDKRLELLEESVKQFNSLATSTEKLAVNMENMMREQQEQGKRLEVLENRDGDMWRTVVKYLVTAFAGLVVGYIGTHIGF